MLSEPEKLPSVLSVLLLPPSLSLPDCPPCELKYRCIVGDIGGRSSLAGAGFFAPRADALGGMPAHRQAVDPLLAPLHPLDLHSHPESRTAEW